MPISHSWGIGFAQKTFPIVEKPPTERFVMDANERIAHDLEMAQTKRFRKTGEKYNFFSDPVELDIFEHIKSLRDLSKTYHPDNAR